MGTMTSRNSPAQSWSFGWQALQPWPGPATLGLPRSITDSLYPPKQYGECHIPCQCPGYKCRYVEYNQKKDYACISKRTISMKTSQ